MKHFALFAVLLALLTPPVCDAAVKAIPLPGDGKADAVKAAQTWVALLDGGKYDESWKQAAAQLKQAVSRKKWQTTMSPLRDPLGAVTGTRQEKSVQLTREIPGAPDAQYAIVEFTTSFANKPAATETVTLVWEKDGRWRVASYAIR